MQENFYSRRLEKQELDKVQEVYNNTRNANFEQQFFLKKFISNCKNKFISVMYFDAEKPIAHCAAIPFDFSCSESGSKELVGAQVIDAVTLEAYQRRGLFNKLNNEIDQIATADQLDLLFRFPSPINYKRVIDNFEFTKTEDFKKFDFKFKVLFPIFKVFQKFEWIFLLSSYLKILSLITFSNNRIIENSLTKQGFYHIPHNAGFFAYKQYSENFRLNIFGDHYWVKQGDGLIVGDFKIKSSKNFMKKLKVFCFIFGIHRVSLNVCEGTNEYELLSRYQKPTDGMSVCMKSIGQNLVDLPKIKFTYADLDTF